MAAIAMLVMMATRKRKGACIMTVLRDIFLVQNVGLAVVMCRLRRGWMTVLEMVGVVEGGEA